MCLQVWHRVWLPIVKQKTRCSEHSAWHVSASCYAQQFEVITCSCVVHMHEVQVAPADGCVGC